MISRPRRFLTTPLFALAALGAGGATVAVAAQDWNLTVTRTDGGVRIGRADAPVKLTAFLSYTCPACGAFSEQADGTLALSYVGPGRVALEQRAMVRDPVDLTATMLVACIDPRRYAAAHATFMERQSTWLARAQSIPAAQRGAWDEAYTSATPRRAIAAALDFYPMVERFGLNRVRADNCLANQAQADALVAGAQTNRSRYGVSGTPSFAIDGVLLAGTHDWALLQPQLDARLAPAS